MRPRGSTGGRCAPGQLSRVCLCCVCFGVGCVSVCTVPGGGWVQCIVLQFLWLRAALWRLGCALSRVSLSCLSRSLENPRHLPPRPAMPYPSLQTAYRPGGGCRRSAARRQNVRTSTLGPQPGNSRPGPQAAAVRRHAPSPTAANVDGTQIPPLLGSNGRRAQSCR
jgi:hypothetical protein